MLRIHHGRVWLFLCLIALSSTAFSQYTPGVNNNVTLLSHVDNYSTYSNIWGYVDGQGREYALIGHNAGTSIVDITSPAAPVEVTMIPGPVSTGTCWREIKTYGQHAYVVSEHTEPNNLAGIQIIDLSNLPAGATLANVALWPEVTSSNARAHTVTVDSEGYLYIQGGTATRNTGGEQGGIRIFNLNPDPLNPAPVGIFNPRYAHDTFVQDSLLFAFNIYEGGFVDILNISDRSNPQPVQSLVYPQGFSHTGWTTPDRKYLVTTDEIAGLTVKVWDIQVLWDNDPTNNDQIDLVGEYISNPTQIAHEPRVRGNNVFVAHYLEGMRVLDISNPADPVEVGYYDTYLPAGNGFSGDWGVYPFFPSGNFVVSDMQSGLYVLRFDSLGAGGIEGVVSSAHNGAPLSGAQLVFVEAGKRASSGANGTYSFRTNEGDHTIIVSKPGYFTDTLTVSLPAGANVVQNIALQSTTVGIPGDLSLPLTFRLEQNYPNPFNPNTAISYQLAAASDVELQIYNVAGQAVRTLASEAQTPGKYTVQWDGRNAGGEAVASGVYFYRLVAGDFVQVRKMVLLR